MNSNPSSDYGVPLPTGQAPEKKSVLLSLIFVDPTTHVDEADVKACVEQLADGESPPRLVTFFDGYRYHVGGGHALFAAYEELGFSMADVLAYEGGMPEAMALAARAAAKRAANAAKAAPEPVAEPTPAPMALEPVQAKPTRQSIALDRIRLDGGTQTRESINTDAVAEYTEAMQAGAVFPPIILFFDGSDYWNADGFHRYHAAVQAGFTVIDAEVRSGTIHHARLFASGANDKHGLRRSNAAKRNAAVLALQNPLCATWSDNQIAKEIGLSQPFISNVRRSLISVLSEAQAERTYTNRHGTQSVMNVANIGKAKAAEPAPAPTQPLPAPVQPPAARPVKSDLKSDYTAAHVPSPMPTIGEPNDDAFDAAFNADEPWTGPDNYGNDDLSATPPAAQPESIPAPAQQSQEQANDGFDDEELTPEQQAAQMAELNAQEEIKRARIKAVEDLAASDDKFAEATRQINQLIMENTHDRMSFLRMTDKASALAAERDKLQNRVRYLEREKKALQTRIEQLEGAANV